MRVARRGRLAALVALSAFIIPVASAHAAPPPLPPLDPQDWSTEENQSWNDYKALPGPDYSDASIQPTVKKWKVALVLTDFPDKPFTISQPVGATVFGTPTAEAHDIPRMAVPQFYQDFLNTPSALNHYQTMNRYWMEDTHGKYGAQLDAYGPYQMPGRSYQYFEQGFDRNGVACPTKTVTPCNKDFRTDAKAAWVADVGSAVVSSYDNVFYVSAGQDQSATWQEFGEMKFADQNSIPDAFGPKAFDSTLPNWAPTRYISWTSWASGSTIWPNAVTSGAKPLSSIEAESSGLGTYTHELTHNLGILDNYNNPYSTPVQRSATGPWDMMSRGSFGGPGGTHARWFIPPTTGGALGSQHNVRNKLKLGFVTPEQVLQVSRNGLATSGMVVANVTAREVDPGSGLSGVQVNLDGGDKEPKCSYTTDPLCDGGGFNAYIAEVVQQIGSDSFDPGHGVLLSKSKTSENSSCGTFSCFDWVIDAHPQDIDMVDFTRPGGSVQKVTIGDQRQLDDATFNAGTGSGSSYQYEDTANRLRFYVIDMSKDAQGMLHYTLAVQSLDGDGPQTRGVKLASAAATGVDGSGWETCTFPLTDTGSTGATAPTGQTDTVAPYLTGDVYNLSVSTSGEGWSAQLRNALATAKFGDTVQVPVYFTRGAGAGSVTLTATSASDPSKSASATCATASVGGDVPATLNLTLGAPATFGAFTPGLAFDYVASTTATVVSTAGDAALTVADPSATATGHLVNGSFSLAQPLQVQGNDGAFAAVGGSADPTTLLSYSGPIANDPVRVGFKQSIGANDALRTGSYAKTLTFTLSTTTP